MSSNSHTSGTRRARRVAAAVLAGTALFAGNGGVAAASDGTQHTVKVTMSSMAHLTAPNQQGVSAWSLVADTCSLVTDGGAPEPCKLNANGSIWATGGDGNIRVATSDRVFRLDETAEFTGPTTGIAYGPAVVTGDGGAPVTGSFVGDFEFYPSDKPGWALDIGRLTITY